MTYATPFLRRAFFSWRIRFARSSSRRREADKFLPPRLMKYWIIRIPEPRPFGETRRLAIVRAICCAEPENVPGGGNVDTVLTFLTQRFPTVTLSRPA